MNMLHIASADDLFQNQLQKLYSIETQILETLPFMLGYVHSPELRQLLTHHFDETKNQAKRLEELGAEMDIAFDFKQDKGMKGILDEGKMELESVKNPQLTDTVIIGGNEKVEQYEMAAYQSAIELAKKMGMDEVADILEENYNEEKNLQNFLRGLQKGA